LVFEGSGFVYETKHKNASLKWSGLPIIVTSNRLPWILSDKGANSANE